METEKERECVKNSVKQGMKGMGAYDYHPSAKKCGSAQRTETVSSIAVVVVRVVASQAAYERF
jgi:hypothetical protein